MQLVKGIAQHVHAVNASAARGSDKLKFSINVLVHKSDPQVATIAAGHQAALQNGFPAGLPAGADICWTDCAVTEPANAALSQYWRLRASTNVEHGQPQIMDMAQQPILDPALDGKLSGQVVWFGGDFASYTAGKQGVKCYFNGLMVTGEQGTIPTEALSSKPDMTAAFAQAAAGGVVPQAAAPVPVAGQPAPIPGAPVAAPVPAPVPAPMAPPAAPVPQPQHVMTAAAQGATYEAMIAAGWTDETLIQNGMMQPPGGVAPAFMG